MQSQPFRFVGGRYELIKPTVEPPMMALDNSPEPTSGKKQDSWSMGQACVCQYWAVSPLAPPKEVPHKKEKKEVDPGGRWGGRETERPNRG
jgi:hypothetical protein